MKHEVTSLNTKKALAAALKELMTKKPLSKITVSDIISVCGVNRKTFYYHFQDIYDLLKWILEQEAFLVIAQFDLMVDLEQAITFGLDYVENNKHILACAYDSIGRDHLKLFLEKDFHKIVSAYIEGVAKKKNLTVKPDLKVFLERMYTEILAAMLIDIVTGKHNFDKKTSIEYTVMIFKSSLPAILQASL